MVTQYDKESIAEIIEHDQGTYFTAHVLRFLDKVLSKSDATNLGILLTTWPDECRLIYEYWGWPEESINQQFMMFARFQ